MDDIYIADSKRCALSWNDSLYRPLQSLLYNSLQSFNQSRDIFVYIGCGPNAPIFDAEDHCLQEIAQFKKIILLDISEQYLAQAQQKALQCFSDKVIECYVYDITNGLCNFFYQELMSIFISDKARNNTITKNHLAILEKNIRDNIQERIFFPIKECCYIYSELVATYTGIPAIYDFEMRLNQIQDSQNKTMDFIYDLWKIYNEYIYLFHLKDLSNFTRQEGRITIATDIEKIYIENNYDSIPSFRNVDFIPQQHFSKNKLIYKNHNIIWDDSDLEKYDALAHNNTLPHLHRVGFYTYEKV